MNDMPRPPALRLSAHIGYLFGEYPLERRPEAARKAGFHAVEHPQPFAIPAERMRSLLDGEGLSFIQLAVAGGGKGVACLPERRTEFRDGLEQSLDYAEAIGCTLVHPLAGVAPSGVDETTLWHTYLDNLAYAAGCARRRGIDILIEPISRLAVPGYLLHTADLALLAVESLDVPNLLLLVDTYHARANGLDTESFLRANAERVGHVHVADFPGRHEPGTGQIDFVPLVRTLAEIRYPGAIGFEYVPVGETTGGLGWMTEWSER